MSLPSLLIILPCFNEEEVLPYSIKKISSLLNAMIEKNEISQHSRLVFIDDGSTDKTWSIIKKESDKYNHIQGIKLSRNYGHQNAILSGLLNNLDKFDIYITMDVDLQDDMSIIPKMVQLYKEGNQIVYGVRKNREVDSTFKQYSAKFFYKLQSALGIKIIENHADFRLISNRVLNELNNYNETNLFLRAIFPLIGYKSEKIYYDRLNRTAGESKYPLLKMLKFAADGISSFSIRPLRLIFFIGLCIFIVSLFLSIWVLYGALFTDNTVPGWASTVLPLYFIGGIQLLSLGIIGEYIGKIYIESKSRPRYSIEEEV